MAVSLVNITSGSLPSTTDSGSSNDPEADRHANYIVVGFTEDSA